MSKYLSMLFVIVVLAASVLFFAGDLVKKISDEPLAVEGQNNNETDQEKGIINEETTLKPRADASGGNAVSEAKLSKSPALGRP